MADLVRTHHQGDKDSHEGADTPVYVSLHAKHTTIEGYKALIIEAADVVAIVWRGCGLKLDKGGRYGGYRFISWYMYLRLDHRSANKFIFFTPSHLDVTFYLHFEAEGKVSMAHTWNVS